MYSKVNYQMLQDGSEKMRKYKIAAALLSLLVAAACTPRQLDGSGQSSLIMQQSPLTESPGAGPEDAEESQEEQDYNPFTEDEEMELLACLDLFLSTLGPSNVDGIVSGGDFFTPNALNEEAVLYYCLMNLYRDDQAGLVELAMYDDFYYAVTPRQVAEEAGMLLDISGFAYKDDFYYAAAENVYKYGPGHGGMMQNYQVTETAYTEDGRVYYTVVFYNQGDEQLTTPVMSLYYRFAIAQRENGAYYLVPVDASKTPKT